MNLKTFLLSAAVASAGLTLSNVHAQALPSPATDDMAVTITIENACEISTAPTTLDFGAHGVLSANVDNESTMSVTCTTAAPYDIGLDAGLNGAGDITARKMINGLATVDYQLYQAAGRTTVWGDTVDDDRLASEGTGTAQLFTVYGRVPPQTTPPAGVYTDTVAVTVTY